MTGCEIIDAHFHHHQKESVWRTALERASERGVTQIWVSDVPWRGRCRPAREEVQHLNGITREIVARHGDLFCGFLYVDPKDERNAMSDVRRGFEEEGMSGIKLWISCFCDEPCVSPVAEYAQERRIPILVHAWDKATGNYEFESTAANVANLARRFPELPVILAHHGGDWIHACREIAPFPNILSDTSGSIIDHGLVEYMVDCLGPKRVLFGTDNSDFHAMFAKVVAARLDEDTKRLVLSGNAQRLLEQRQ